MRVESPRENAIWLVNMINDHYDQVPHIDDVEAFVGEWKPHAPDTLRKVEWIESFIPYNPVLDENFETDRDGTIAIEIDMDYYTVLTPLRASAYGLIPCPIGDRDKYEKLYSMYAGNAGYGTGDFDGTIDYVPIQHPYCKPEERISPPIKSR